MKSKPTKQAKAKQSKSKMGSAYTSAMKDQKAMKKVKSMIGTRMKKMSSC